MIFCLSKTFARLVRGTITVPTTTRQEAGGVRCVIGPLCPFEPGKDDILWLLQFHDIAAQRGDECGLNSCGISRSVRVSRSAALFRLTW